MLNTQNRTLCCESDILCVFPLKTIRPVEFMSEVLKVQTVHMLEVVLNTTLVFKLDILLLDITVHIYSNDSAYLHNIKL